MQVKVVPCNILDYLRVRVPFAEGVDRWGQLIRLINIPQTDFVVIAATQEQAQLIGVPIETVAFFAVSKQSQIWLDFISAGFAPLLEIIKNVDFSADGLRRYYFVRLRHRAASINFALMVYLHFDLNSVFFILTWLV